LIGFTPLLTPACEKASGEAERKVGELESSER